MQVLFSVTDAPAITDEDVIVFHGDQAEITDVSQLPAKVSLLSRSPLVPHLPLAPYPLQPPEPASDDLHSASGKNHLHSGLFPPLSRR